MSIAAAEVKQSIYRRWQEPKVAAWVIDQMPLLRRNSQPEVPIYTLRFIAGLQPINNARSRFSDFRSTPKFVISGGLAGTEGHEKSVRQMWDIRALMSRWDESAIAVLLEPDSYMWAKGRRPLVDLTHRTLLWSESGLVDAVVTLPTKRNRSSPIVHYERVHGWISPAKWVSNPENPAALSIVERGVRGASEVMILLTKHAPRPHSSFLVRTQDMSVKETRNALFDHVLSMVRRPELYAIAEGQGTPRDHARILFEEISRGL